MERIYFFYGLNAVKSWDLATFERGCFFYYNKGGLMVGIDAEFLLGEF